jgi:predicted DNA-binding protein
MAQATVSTFARLPVPLSEKLDAHCAATGETKTAVIIAALEKYLPRGGKI